MRSSPRIAIDDSPERAGVAGRPRPVDALEIRLFAFQGLGCPLRRRRHEIGAGLAPDRPPLADRRRFSPPTSKFEVTPPRCWTVDEAGGNVPSDFHPLPTHFVG